MTNMVNMVFFIWSSLLYFTLIQHVQGKVGYLYDNQNQLKCRAVSLVGPTQTNGKCGLMCNQQADPPCMGFAMTNQGCEHCMKCPVSSPWQNLTSGQLYEGIPVDFSKELQKGKGFSFKILHSFMG